MDAPEELHADLKIVLAIVQQYGDALKYASEMLRAYHKVMLAAVQKEGRALQYALRGAPRRPRDRLGGRAAEWYCIGGCLGGSPRRPRDRFGGRSAEGYALMNASEELRADHEIVLAAVPGTLSLQERPRDTFVTRASPGHFRYKSVPGTLSLQERLPDLGGSPGSPLIDGQKAPLGPRKGTLRLTGAFTDNKGNAYAAARFHSTKLPLSCIVMELATQLEARGLWMDLHWTPRELNTLADQLTNEDFTGFDPKLRVETSFSTLPFVALPSLLESGAALKTEVGNLNACRALAPPPPAKRRLKADALRSKEPW
jgi:hypothetical protein